MTLFCPATGLPIRTRPEWKDVKLGEEHGITLYIIGSSFVYSAPRGNVTLETVTRALKLYDDVLQGVEGYIQIEDYALLSQATQDAKKEFIRYMNRNDRFKAIIFCNLSPIFNISVKIGNRFIQSSKPVYTAATYADAVTLALSLSKAYAIDPGPYVFEKPVRYRPESPTLTPVDLKTDNAWVVKTETFVNTSRIIDHRILHSESMGFFDTCHVPMVNEKRHAIRAALGPEGHIDHVIVNSSKLTGSNYRARQQYMKSFREWHSRFPLALFIFYGANPFVTTAALLSRPFMPFKLRVADDLEAAFEMIHQHENPKPMSGKAGKPSNAPLVKDYVDELVEFIGSIHWDHQGSHASLSQFREDHPFIDVFRALSMVKDELDDLFREREAARESLKKSEEKYRELFEKGSDIICIHALDGAILETNLAFKKEYGISEEQAADLNVLDLLIPENTGEFHLYIQRLKTGGSDRGRFTIITAEGNRRVLEYDAVLFTDPDGKPSIVKVSARDITSHLQAQKNKKKLEEQQTQTHKLEAIGTLAGGIAHDFNNIMMGLMGNLSLAKDEIPGQTIAHQLIEDAEKSVSRARALTNQLLTFARGGEPIKQAVTLADIVRETAQFHLAGSNVRLNMQLAHDLWPGNVDKGQIGQVVSNLVINARQAMQDGGNLWIEAWNMEPDPDNDLFIPKGRYIAIRFTDEGPGIPEENLNKLFDPYFTTKETGNGLGLSIVHSILSKHSGHIRVSPGKESRGTAFTIYLPAAKETVQETGIRQIERELNGIQGSHRALIMDDEPIVREISIKMLKHLGFLADGASDGKEAVKLYQQAFDMGAPYDIIIMDLTIPGGMGGKEAIRDVLAINPEAVVIVASGYSTDAVMADYESYGFKGIAIKPYSINDLKTIITQVLAPPAARPN